MNFFRHFKAVLLLLVVLLLSGCASVTPEPIVGTWVDQVGTLWTFKSDHTFVQSNAKFASALAARRIAVNGNPRLEWKLANGSPYSTLTISSIAPSGNVEASIAAIQQFSSTDAMRIGFYLTQDGPPKDFESSDVVIELQRQK